MLYVDESTFILLAAPTMWVIFKFYYAFANPVEGSSLLMLNTHRWFYYLFLWQKPVAAVLVAATILWTERPYGIVRRIKVLLVAK